MITLRTVNKAIAHLGDIELVKGNGYFYFVGEDVNVWAEGVYVYRLNELSLERWIEEAKVAQKASPWDYNAPYNPEFLGAQPARAGQDY